MEKVSVKDRNILRSLAGKWAEAAASDGMARLKKRWLANNMRQKGRPMATIETGTFAGDVIPQLLKCGGEAARNAERRLWNSLINVLYFKDDTVLERFFPLWYRTWLSPFGINPEMERTSGLAYRYLERVADLEKDFALVQKESAFNSDKKGIDEYAAFFDGIFGDILPVKITGRALGVSLTQQLVHIMSMETMFTSMYDYPDLFKSMMDGLSGDYIKLFRYTEKEGLLSSTTGSEWVGQGTYAFTSELPDKPVSSRDVWGYMDSQETVNISPDMFSEFIFPYYRKIAGELGLISYGCCEPVHPFWRDISKIKNVRKVSVSPWCDEEFIGERLAESDIVYHRKPSPNFLGVGKTLDEDGLRLHIRGTLRAAKNCAVEFTQRDVYTVGGDIGKCARFIEIIREEIDKHS